MLRKLIITLNLLFVFLMLGIVIASYNFSGAFGFFSVLQLFTPLIFVVHVFFAIFWMFRERKWSLISFATLLIACGVFGTFYKFDQTSSVKGEFSVMSYNVMGFNRFGWIPIPDAGDKISNFIRESKPDILCIQEHRRLRWRDLTQYPYRTETPYRVSRSIQAIFSKFPIIDNGSLNPPGTGNNIIYADIVLQRDTVRIYNVHLESFKIVPSETDLSHEASTMLYRRMLSTFKAQSEQAMMLKRHLQSCPYKILICGDFNNTQFSNVYRILTKEMNDSFLTVGSGLGKTYALNGLPMRIDYILASDAFIITAHNNFDIKYSDHYPVMATLKLKSGE